MDEPFTQEGKIGKYAVDFVLSRHRIALEVDGAYWHQDPARDARKTKYLTQHGWHVCRITEAELNNTKDLPTFITLKLQQVSDFQ